MAKISVNFHIGSLIKEKVEEHKIDVVRICNFLKCTEDDIKKMYKAKSMDSNILLRWSKLLEYDFFRLYSQYWMLYVPKGTLHKDKAISESSSLPRFRKNIYTKELMDFIINEIETGKKTKVQAIREYEIPKTTLYKWMRKK